MLRIFVCSLLLCVTSSADLKNDLLNLYQSAQALSKDINSLEKYQKFAKQFKNLPEGKTRDMFYCTALLGAQLHGREAELKFFHKCVAEKASIESLAKTYHANMNEAPCYTCAGKKKFIGSCVVCKGKKKCPNNNCKGGQTISLSRTNGKFARVKKECGTCKGTSKCQPCEGNGKIERRCFKCNQNGKVLNKRKSMQMYQALLVKLILAVDKDYKFEVEKAKNRIE